MVLLIVQFPQVLCPERDNERKRWTIILQKVFCTIEIYNGI
jgi:hypothetical protein